LYWSRLQRLPEHVQGIGSVAITEENGQGDVVPAKVLEGAIPPAQRAIT